TQIMAEKEGFSVDHHGYEVELEKQRERSREGLKSGIISFLENSNIKGGDKFTGYDKSQTETIIIHDHPHPDLDYIPIILEKTPFYAESGGQVGDKGIIYSEEYGVELKVRNTTLEDKIIVHECIPITGNYNDIPVPQVVNAKIDSERRQHIQRNHTATHLLHKALHQVLGDHATQAGSWVGPDRLRFDFAHFKAMTDDEISEVEKIVNKAIMADYPVKPQEDVAITDAKSEGAMALFGEKYGDSVRVIRIKKPDKSNYSIELCGGTHVDRTGEIGSF
ncbi:MAG: alanine--tRNA ligase, partial [candidate division Zixibacteria bacterium]|nr:alanine--tRNA ligase [candidate division Zixibacteria bacterium]